MLSRLIRNFAGTSNKALLSTSRLSSVLTPLPVRNVFQGTNTLSSSAFAFGQFRGFSTGQTSGTNEIAPVEKLIADIKKNIFMLHVSIPVAVSGGGHKRITSADDLAQVLEHIFKLSQLAISQNTRIGIQHATLLLKQIPEAHLRQIIDSVDKLNKVMKAGLFDAVTNKLLEKLDKEHINKLFTDCHAKDLENCPNTDVLLYLENTTARNLIDSVEKLQSTLAWSNSMNLDDLVSRNRTNKLLGILGIDHIMRLLHDGRDLAKVIEKERVPYGYEGRLANIDAEEVMYYLHPRLDSFKNIENPRKREESTMRPSMGLRFDPR
jgi:hypothetical protein